MSSEQPTAGTSADAQKKKDTRKLEKTRHAGIYKRGPKSYVVTFRAGGRQRKEFARTLDEARRIKRERETDRDRGEWQERTTVTFREYLTEWVETYTGTGKRGFRESTRVEYRRLLDNYAHRYFGEKLRLVDVTPGHLAQFVTWLCDESKQTRRLSDKSVANAVIPVRAALSTATRQGKLRHNPAVNLALPYREEVKDDDHEDVKALSREQLRQFLAIAPDRHRLLLELLAATGLRISEALALQRQHLTLDGSRPVVRVRRARVKGEIVAPKTKHGRRDVPVSAALVDKLRARVADLPDDPEALIFATASGSYIDADNLRARIVKPLMQEIGAPWAAFHTMRHTFASLQLASGVNIVQLSRVMGHHSAAFTLTRYVHLLPGEEAPALDLADALQETPIGSVASPNYVVGPTEEAA